MSKSPKARRTAGPQEGLEAGPEGQESAFLSISFPASMAEEEDPCRHRIVEGLLCLGMRGLGSGHHGGVEEGMTKLGPLAGPVGRTHDFDLRVMTRL